MDEEELEESLLQYKLQLGQIEEVLKVTPKGPEYESLHSLKSDIQQLIELTAESIETITKKKQTENRPSGNDPLKDEYELFMAEMSSTGAFEKEKTETEAEAEPNIDEEIAALEGMKCSAPYDHKWGGFSTFHNAMVCSVIREDSTSDFHSIKVRILFTNPTHTEMIPCPFFLDGSCKFSDEQCRYSHGEVVLLSSLSEAIEPNFASLKSGSRALVKLKSDNEPGSSKASDKHLLWHRAIVTHVDSEKHKCEIKLEKNGINNHHNVDFDHVFPLPVDDCSESSDSDSEVDIQVAENERIINQTLMADPTKVKLGDWEKYTKGIGSKLMEKMGYVIGSGLGPDGLGRVEPVPCQLIPVGKSLDHCMELKECAEKGGDPIKMEKRLRRQKKKQEDREKKAYDREKEKEKHDVFTVLNTIMATKKKEIKTESKKTDVKSSSCKNLNIEQFKISEEMKRVDKDIEKLKSSLSRSDKGSQLFNGIKAKLESKSRERDGLRSRQTDITKEQGFRKDKKSMSVF